MEKSGPSGSPKAKPSAEEEAQRRLVKCMRRMRDMLYGDGKAEPCVKQSKVGGCVGVWAWPPRAGSSQLTD